VAGGNESHRHGLSAVGLDSLAVEVDGDRIDRRPKARHAVLLLYSSPGRK
jgi:hypothetical protein